MRISDWSSDVCSSDLWARACEPPEIRRSRGVLVYAVVKKLNAPDVVVETHPVLAQYFFDTGRGPARLFHDLRQVGELADGADSLRDQDSAEVGKAAIVALVVGDHVAEACVVAYRHVQSYSHEVVDS